VQIWYESEKDFLDAFHTADNFYCIHKNLGLSYEKIPTRFLLNSANVERGWLMWCPFRKGDIEGEEQQISREGSVIHTRGGKSYVITEFMLCSTPMVVFLLQINSVGKMRDIKIMA
jgi:hypothetical protein